MAETDYIEHEAKPRQPKYSQIAGQPRYMVEPVHPTGSLEALASEVAKSV